MFHEKQASIQKNQHCYLIAASAYMVLTGILSDGFVQAYMNKLGMTAQTIGLYGALAQIAAMLAYAFSTSFLNGPTSFQRSYLFTTFGLLAMPVGLFLSHVISTPWIVAFILIAAGMIYQALIAIRNTSEYDLIPYVVPRTNYGILLSRAGVIGGLSAVGLTTLSQSLIDKIGFPQGYDNGLDLFPFRRCREKSSNRLSGSGTEKDTSESQHSISNGIADATIPYTASTASFPRHW